MDVVLVGALDHEEDRVLHGVRVEARVVHVAQALEGSLYRGHVLVVREARELVLEFLVLQALILAVLRAVLAVAPVAALAVAAVALPVLVAVGAEVLALHLGVGLPVSLSLVHHSRICTIFDTPFNYAALAAAHRFS